MAKVMTARQRQGAETRREILEATKALFATADYQAITLERVAREVGISRTSVLWHFDSKEGLLTTAVLEMFEDLESAALLGMPALPTLSERIDHVFDMVGDYFDRHPEWKGILLSIIFNGEVPAAIRERAIAHLVDDQRKLVAFLSTPAEPVTEDQVAGLVALIHGAYIQWYADGHRGSFRERLKALYEAMPFERQAPAGRPAG